MEILYLATKREKHHTLPPELAIEKIYKKVQLSKGYLLYRDVFTSQHPKSRALSSKEQQPNIFKIPHILDKPLLQMFEGYVTNENNTSTSKKLIEYFGEILKDKYDYKASPEDIRSIEISLLQNAMTDSKMAILSFFCCSKAIYGIYITKEGFIVKKCASNEKEVHELKRKTKEFHTLIYEDIPDFKHNQKSNLYSYSTEEQECEKYMNLASWLYNKLIAPFVEPNTLNRLYIIPDGFLCKLDFDALVVSKYNGEKYFNELPYLLHEYCIGYHFSVPLFYNLYHKSTSPINTFLYVLASAKTGEYEEAYNTLSLCRKLEQNRKNNQAAFSVELDLACGEQFNTDCTGQELKRFFIAIKFAQAVIIRSHGTVYNEMAALDLGGEEKITSQNIKQLKDSKQNIELLILHSCQSGQGVIRIGEGIIALSRAFMAAGTKNIIYTTSNVNVLSSSNLLKTFWKILCSESNISIAQALNKAKRKMSKGQQNKRYPNDWCSIQFMGDQTRKIN